MLSYCFALAVMFTNTLCAPAVCTPCKMRDPQNLLEKPSLPTDRSLTRVGSHADAGRDDSEPAIARTREKCCPYNFDSSLCQIVNDRVLCGYNRNIGRPENNSEPVRLSAGCRMRGGRLECGYEQGPFNNLRRPPAWNYGDNPGPSQDPDSDAYYDENDDGTNIHKLSKKVSRKERLTGATKKVKLLKGVTKCVEIKERIVCKQV